MEFIWDEGNRNKNWEKHRVTCEEAEQCFYNPHVILVDEKHSVQEVRYYLFGETHENRSLTIVFALRAKNSIRIISARPMHRNEKTFYEKNKKNS